MPRKARIDAPGALQHIIVRGIKRRKIFFDDSDRDDFLDRLGGTLSDSKRHVLRALEALHVACALEWQADLFATSDKRQFKSAINTELHSEFIGQQISGADSV